VDFCEAQSYLFSLGNEVETMKLGLENIRKLLKALGDPQGKYTKVQVAGTNGKGSVCAFLDSIYLQAGVRTGRFTSPHLISIRERVKVGGEDISEDDFAKYATRVKKTGKKLVSDGTLEAIPTFFEQVTAIALLAFAEAKVELAILETGLGGRFDATTAADAEIAVITRIDLDHQEYLGETIEQIAAEKAAIIRADSKAVVVGEQVAWAGKVIFERCAEFGIVPRLAAHVRSKPIGGSVDIKPLGPVELGLRGTHQVENAKVAIVAVEALNKLRPESDAITVDNVVRGLEKATHPGRLEYIRNFLLDGAHNPGGAKSLRDFLLESESRPITLIYGAMKDKDVV